MTHTVTEQAQEGAVMIGGPIQHAMTNGTFDPGLRNAIERLTAVVAEAGHTVTSAHLAERFGDDGSDLYVPALVTKRDYDWVAEADAYVAVLPIGPDGEPIHSAGTCIELGWASYRGLPIVVLWDDRQSAKYSHLIRGLHNVAQVEYLDLETCLVDVEPLLHALRQARSSEPTGRV